MILSCWIWWSSRSGILLTEYEFPGDEVPVVRGSALKALDGDESASDQIMELMDAVDSYVPEPDRDTDKPFLMSIEDVFSVLRVGGRWLRVGWSRGF